MGSDGFREGKPKRVGGGGLGGVFSAGPGHRSKPKWKLQLSQSRGVQARRKNGNAKAIVERESNRMQGNAKATVEKTAGKAERERD